MVAGGVGDALGVAGQVDPLRGDRRSAPARTGELSHRPYAPISAACSSPVRSPMLTVVAATSATACVAGVDDAGSAIASAGSRSTGTAASPRSPGAHAGHRLRPPAAGASCFGLRVCRIAASSHASRPARRGGPARARSPPRRPGPGSRSGPAAAAACPSASDDAVADDAGDREDRQLPRRQPVDDLVGVVDVGGNPGPRCWHRRRHASPLTALPAARAFMSRGCRGRRRRRFPRRCRRRSAGRSARRSATSVRSWRS